ncbi:polysaccharide deacetylase family protein [Nocardiopsis changdeensis]|uniref:Polysaccharide deacetylase family protein n=1 Tax=Nocardiopsis changdeensis TaxID=2831969 RepID=A0ABX8BUK0_9ACTN|nr:MULTISPECIES: polysaccharide deacetylase family protein [Nocardiopsis]QUX25375.1 polysaccharide deacetylase family protein [Nocardiopsis changdeensis]QYX35761.1 polysaccharide deacetylase family protein [Nocardiopsis sp. MT53]
MPVTSISRKLAVTAVLGLLLVPGCHAAEPALPYAEAVRIPLDAWPAVQVGTRSVATDAGTVGYRYPILGPDHPLTTEIHTSMAERQTEFLEDLPENGTPELLQDATMLAASPKVVGVRVTETVKAGVNETFGARTLWYDAEHDTVLPWTSLFRDEEAIESAHLALAGVLEDDYDMPTEQLPGLVGEVALRAAQQEEAPDSGPGEAGVGSAPPSPGATGEDTAPLDLSDPEQALRAAELWEGSPLADLAFSTAGGLAVRMEPGDVPEAGRVSEVLLPVQPEDTEGLLSELGYHAREAALSGEPDFPLDGELSAEGDSLDCSRLKCVALTFDDGPGEDTERLLDMLAEYDARATFYVLGSLVGEFPEVVERTHAEGHEMGNHSWKHDDLAGKSEAGVAEDITRTNEAVRAITGSDPLTIRPPYGSLNGTVRRAVDQPLILWDVDTMDWQSRDTAKVAGHALEHTTAGSVVLFHDIHPSTVDAVPEVLEGLHRKGYHFVTVTDLFGLEALAPGDVFTDARVN